MTEIVWTQKTARFTNGKVGRVGKWVLFSVDWDSSSSREDGNKYKLTTRLPGLKPEIAKYENESDAMKRADSVLDFWMQGLEDE